MPRSRKQKKGEPVPQSTPSFQRLLEKYNSGYTSRKEITRRVKNPPDELPPEEQKALDTLKSIAIASEWL